MITRRRLLRLSFWSTLGGAAGACSAGALAYAAPRPDVAPIDRALIPEPGGAPVRLPGARALLVHLRPGEGGLRDANHGRYPPTFDHDPPPSPTGGLLALDPRCTLPMWSLARGPALFTRFEVRLWSEPWFSDGRYEGLLLRCPACDSTFTASGQRLYGPAPWPLVTLPLHVSRDGNLSIRPTTRYRGDADNALRAVPLPPTR